MTIPSGAKMYCPDGSPVTSKARRCRASSAKNSRDRSGSGSAMSIGSPG
ncbi:hypothetical protein J0H58_00015 [bacterium]|nr:hypothetical protein [bacterium]